MNKAGKLFIVLSLVVVLGLPFLLQRSEKVTRFADDTVVIITPHTESIRYEFARAFEKWYEEKTGRTIFVDYRVIGGTSEIGKFLNSEYTNSFRNYWENELGREWTLAVQEGFSDPYSVPDSTPGDDTPAEAAKRAFLASEASSGIDLFFGGGAYDFRKQAGSGNLVDAGLLQKRPEWFQETAIPGEIPEAIPQSISTTNRAAGTGPSSPATGSFITAIHWSGSASPMNHANGSTSRILAISGRLPSATRPRAVPWPRPSR